MYLKSNIPVSSGKNYDRTFRNISLGNWKRVVKAGGREWKMESEQCLGLGTGII
jgi:hypothetical protein